MTLGKARFFLERRLKDGLLNLADRGYVCSV